MAETEEPREKPKPKPEPPPLPEPDPGQPVTRGRAKPEWKKKGK